MTSPTDFYDDLDYPNAFSSSNNRLFDPRTVDEYINLICIGSTVKDNLIKQTQKDTTNDILFWLSAIIKEQVLMKQISIAAGAYILDSIQDLARRKQWTE